MYYAHNIKITRNDVDWTATITADITPEGLEHYYKESLKEAGKNAKIDGFRPGHAPVDRIEQIYGETAILRMAAEAAVQEELPNILAQEKLLIIEAPRVSTMTPERGKSLSFTAVAPLLPHVELPDYSTITEKHHEIKDDLTVSDAEHTDALTHIRRERARIEKIEAGTEPQKAHEEAALLSDQDLPILDDAFVLALGYASVDEFSKVLRENIAHEKQRRAEEKRRGIILDELVKISKVSYPAVMREYELDDMEAQMRYDLSRMGTTLEQYLADSKKTQPELRESWKENADKRVKIRLILSEISRKEHLEPTDEVIDHELSHAIEHNAKVDRASMRSHIAHSLRNELTLRFLEGTTTPIGHADHSEHSH